MGSARARISFDPSRDYRSVVAQQGRVTLEADVNEQASIAGEALRLETIDIIGPAGTPDNGYEVSYSGGTLVVGKGTMYLGGWRLALTAQVPLNQQPDWLDRPQVPTQIPELIALLVTEQFVSPTEDQALREVALGGPDTAARTRLMQHFLELPTHQHNCAGAAKDLDELLHQNGFTFHPKSGELTWNAKLKVSFYPPATPQDPCCPPAQGGYLGADNQLVQVTVTSYDPASRTGTLLWGWNNASFLYRATVVNPGGDPPILKLGQTPVDAEHSPQPGQVVEVLRTTAVLGNAADKNYIAAPQGVVVTLGSGTVFDPATNQLTLPSGTAVPSEPNSLFVRLWQAEVPFTAGTPAQLDTVSGLAVTVTLTALPTGQFLSRPFWQFAVRPNTPQQVYPQRYIENGSAPDGPRHWICDLAVVIRESGAQGAIVDCRKKFVPITEIEENCACCELALDPTQDWQSALAQALASDALAISVCFQPGQYEVTEKITVSDKSIKMRGAGQGTVILGGNLEVVLEFDDCRSVTLSDLSVFAGTAGYSNNPATAGLQGAVTVRNCSQVDIERVSLTCVDADIRSASCLAVYNPPPPSPDQPAIPLQYNVRVLNSQFTPGHSQVGILLVNADRAQVEGNRVSTAQGKRNIKFTELSKHPAILSRLEKQLVQGLTIVDTAPPTTKKGRARLRKKQKTEAALTAPKSPQLAVNAPAVAPAHETAAQPAGAPAAAPAETTSATPAPATAGGAAELVKTAPRLNLGSLGLAHVTATFGTVKLQFISSDKLGNAWSDALRSAGLTASSGVGGVHKAVKKITHAILNAPETVAPAFRNYVTGLLPLLYSTSSQGIVVAGDGANDIRILNNTIIGTAQGVHVGLSNGKTKAGQHLASHRVQICGNTINVRVTPETTGDRHGIFLGSVFSGTINDNELELTRITSGDQKYYLVAGQTTYAIKVAGDFGPQMLLERNCMIDFDRGIVTLPRLALAGRGHLWKAADNASPSGNIISESFIRVDNIRP